MNSLNPVMRDRRPDRRRHPRPRAASAARPALERRVAERSAEVGLPPAVADRYPHELSGGMKQRVGDGHRDRRCSPKVIVADEPTSALDVVVQRQVMQTLGQRAGGLGAAVILIGHDMGLIAQFADTIGVLYAGELVEHRPGRRHPGRAAAPVHAAADRQPADARRQGQARAASPACRRRSLDLPPGCPSTPRCPYAFDRCRVETPLLQRSRPAAGSACHLYPSTRSCRRCRLGRLDPTRRWSELAAMEGENPTGRREAALADGRDEQPPGRSRPDLARQLGETPRPKGRLRWRRRCSSCARHQGLRRRPPQDARHDGRAARLLARRPERVADHHRHRRRKRQRQDDAGPPAARLHQPDQRPGALPRRATSPKMDRAERRQFRREVQPIFQDPFEVFNPFYRVDHVLTTPIKQLRAGQRRTRGARADRGSARARRPAAAGDARALPAPASAAASASGSWSRGRCCAGRS